MTSLDSPLPNRPIKIKRTGVWPGIFRYLGGLMLVGLAAFSESGKGRGSSMTG